MQAYVPQKIIVEEAVWDLPLTRRIRDRFAGIPLQVISDYRFWKEAGPISTAKRKLVVALQRGAALKPFPKIKDAINLGDYVFNPISNCHLECTYCILQSYLKNNPDLTLFANWNHFFSAIKKTVEAEPHRTFRLGTGELSDSLALDEWTGLSRELVPFFAGLPNAYLELKTKTDCIDNLPDLDHRGRTVISWSLAPEQVTRREELKCASLKQRLAAARRVQEAGYPIGLHLDPLIYFEGWEQAYLQMLEDVKRHVNPERVAWVSVGSLRFDRDLKEMATQRFSQTKIFSEDFICSPDGKFRYFKTIRLGMYRTIWQTLQGWSGGFPRYLCMEPPWVWEEVTRETSPSPEQVENQLLIRLENLRTSL